ncbi:MAG: endo-1,4-beta-xylanase [Candidatus Eremiobacteraeota bacterium]|nr:endo-1,4-beta-xylanase [Candidatus Eremiobacteraeota bacterium]
MYKKNPLILPGIIFFLILTGFFSFHQEALSGRHDGIDTAFAESTNSRPFGVFNDMVVEKGGLSIQEALELGNQRTRLILHWKMVEPRKGKFNFALVDRVIDMHHKLGIKPLVTIRCISKWGTKRPSAKDRSAPPRDMSTYRRFIRKVASRYKGKVGYWQIENEVYDTTLGNSKFWNGTKEEYIELLKNAYDEIKKADPGANVVMAGFANVIFREIDRGNGKIKSFFEYLMNKGGNYCDTVDFHQYYEPDTVYNEVKILRDTMKKMGLKKEVISTEAGDLDIRLFPKHILHPEKPIPVVQKFLAIPDVRNKIKQLKKNKITPDELVEFAIFLKKNPRSGPILEKYQAENLVKRYCISLSQGVSQIYWVWMRDQEKPIDWFFGSMCLQDTDGRKKPHFWTYKLLILKLENFRRVKEIKNKTGAKIFRFDMAKGSPKYILWSDNGRKKLDISSLVSGSKVKITRIITQRGKTIRDVKTKTVSPKSIILDETPVFVEYR